MNRLDFDSEVVIVAEVDVYLSLLEGALRLML